MKINFTVRFSVVLLLLFLLTTRCLLLTDVHADITNPQFILVSLDDVWGGIWDWSRQQYADDTGVEFLISLSTEIRTYGLSKNPDIEPPKIVMTLAVNPGPVEVWITSGTHNRVSKYQQLFDMGYQYTSHGHTHTGITPGFLGELTGWDLYFEMRASMDWLRHRLNGCDLGFAFRHGGNVCNTCTKGKWSPASSLMARDLDCWPHGWGAADVSRYDNANWGDNIGGITTREQDKWPAETPLDGFNYWYNGGGGLFLPRISVDSNITNWMSAFDTAYNSGENPRSAVSCFFHDYDVSPTAGMATLDAVYQRRDIIRQFLKTVLVDQNKRYNPSGKYENIYCITYSQYMEYYWLLHGMPEANFTSVQDIINAGNLQTVRYNVEPSTTVEAENMKRKSGGSSVTGGWKLTAGSDYVADIVNFPEEYCNYAIDIVAKGKQGSDSIWPGVQVKMAAMTLRLCKVNTDEDKYFSVVGSSEVNSTGWATYRIKAAFPVKFADRSLYALANGVVFKLANPGNGKELEIDKVTFSRTTGIMQQGKDGYTGCDSAYYSGAAGDSTSDNMKIIPGDCAMYVKYDLSSIPDQSRIARAYTGLYCYVNSGWDASTPMNLDVYQAGTNWASRPALTGSKLDTKKLIYGGYMYEFDVTTAAIAALNSADKKLSLGFKTDDASGQAWYFWSSRHVSEPELRPVLKISYATSGGTDTTAPGAPAVVRDGTGADIDSINSTNSMNPITELSANWDSSADVESGISKYYYAIGTTPGNTNVTNGWLSNDTNTEVTKTGLALSVGVTYFFSVKAENTAGLQSAVASSDGVTVAGTGVSSVYPNPFNLSSQGGMKFKLSANIGGEVKIYTMSGKLVRKLIIENGAIETTWDGTNENGEKVARGIYIYKITEDGGDTKTGKLAISK